MKQFCPVFVVAFAIVALVAGAAAAQARPNDAGATIVSLNLSKYTAVQAIDGGPSVGVRPGTVRVHVGDRVVFMNDDTDHHTATSLVAAVTFVDDPRWTDDALRLTGSIGPGFWSTGDLAPGQRSAPLVARKAGTFLFGCFFDYGAGMRGEIIVEP